MSEMVENPTLEVDDLDDAAIPVAGQPTIGLVSFGFAKRAGVLLERQEHSERHLLYRKPLNWTAFAEVQRMAGPPTSVEGIDPAEFERALSRIYEQASGESMALIEDLEEDLDLGSLMDALPTQGDLLDQDDDAPIIRLINSLLAEAVKVGASDIHVETYETRLIVRFRVDGVLREVVAPQRAIAPLLVSRIKVMARLDIAEKRLPQDGRISVRVGGKEVDVRVSTIPASNGERVVMRLLDKQEGRKDLGHLGMSSRDHQGME